MTVATEITSKKVVPFIYQGSQVRTIQVNGEPFFVATDVCQILDIRNSRDAIKRLDADEVTVSEIPTPSRGLQPHQLVTESGLYHLVFTSTRPGAKAFRKWVTGEVLPALRRSGRYEVGQPAAKGHQLSLFDLEPTEGLRMRDLMFDLALQAKQGSKLAQFIRMVKPHVLGGKGGAV